MSIIMFFIACEMGRRHKLADIRRETKAEVAPDKIVPIRFSFGASFLSDTLEPAALIKNADEEMYSNKRRRKQQM